MNYTIRKVKEFELESAFSLVWNTFLEFEAPDYEQEGIDSFKDNCIENDAFRNIFITGKQTMLGAYWDQKLIGVLSFSRNFYISFCFVAKGYQRKGVASSLFREMLPEAKQNGIKIIGLKSSPYAIPFYQHIGFIAIDSQKNMDGILFTPMEYRIE